MPHIFECVVNISEGRSPDKLSRIAAAVDDHSQVFLLDTSSDFDHHRSVLTFVGPGPAICQATLALCRVASELIDLREHSGVHPRVGAIDVVPFVPLLQTPMSECVSLAQKVASCISSKLGVPTYLYGEAARRSDRRSLAQIRNRLRRAGAESLEENSLHPDFGDLPSDPKVGVTLVGAREVLIAFNVYLKTEQVAIARQIAGRIRESSGGLTGVQALGFYLETRKQAQVSMNLTQYKLTSPLTAFRRISQEAEKHGIEVGSSELVGLIPQDALEKGALELLQIENFDPDLILERRLAGLFGTD